MEKEIKKTSNTTIAIKEELWLELNKRKKPGESFHEVIERLLQKDMSFYDITKKCKTIGDLKELTEEVLDKNDEE